MEKYALLVNIGGIVLKQKRRITSPAFAAVNEGYTKKDTVKVCVFSVLLFLAMTVQTGRMTVILTGIALVAALPIGRPLQNLRQRLCVPVIGFVLFALMQGLAAIYSPFDKYAVAEYYKFLAAFALAVILLVRFEKKHIRGLLWGLAVICAVISLACIDLAVDGIFFHGFNGFVELLGGTFANVEQEALGTRIAGIYNDANVSGSILGLGTLIGLYLLSVADSAKEKLMACLLLGITAQGFFLSMSRGAILCFAVALLIWLIAEEKSKRLRLFLQMFFSAAVTVAVSIPAMSAIVAYSMLVDLLALVSGGILFLLERYVINGLFGVLEKHKKAYVAVVAAVAVVCAGYAVAAFVVTGPAEITSTGSMTRSVALDAGTYAWEEYDWNGVETVRVRWRNKTGALMNEWETLYPKGDAEGVSFTVPDDGGTVSVQFYGEEGSVVSKAAFTGGKALTLNYPLLPSFITERLQDSLLQSYSFLLRVQFLKDAWTIFTQSPLVGHGLGSTEGLYTAVQPFYYESKFVHNHILQIMDDVGLLGLAGFAMLILGAAWLLLRGLKSEERSLAAVLLACWIMMHTHGLMEINFSVRAFQCIAYALMVLAIIVFAKPVSEKAVKVGGWVLSGCICLYLSVFGGLLMVHRDVQTDAANLAVSDVNVYLNYMRDFAKRDVFENEDYKMSFVANAVALGDERYEDTIQDYVKDLRKSGTYTACSGLARYYYLPQGEYAEVFACSREAIAQEASAKEAWNLQLDFYREEVMPAMGAENMDEFLNGVLQTKEYLETYSTGRLEEIELTEENQTFLELVPVVAESNAVNATYETLMMLLLV